MKKNKYQNLFYKKKTKRRYAIAAVLGVTALLGTAVLSLGQPPDAKTDSDAGLKSEVAYEASIAGSNIFSFIEGKISSSADKLVAKASATTNQSTADKAVSSQKFTPLVLRSSVDVTADGETKRISYIGHPTIEDILKKADITLSDTDTVSGSLSKAVTAGETIKVTRVEVSEEEELVETDYETVYEDDDSMTEGESSVKQEGINRVVKEVYQIVYRDGEPSETTVISTEVVQEGQDEIILVGTAPTPVESTSDDSGSSYESSSSDSSDSSDSSSSSDDFSYSNVITCTAYAYVAGGYGSSGNPAVVGTCAVDPSVIPLGTRLYVEGYGYAVANDTGGGIKGRTIDLVMNTATECYQWGARTVNVYILD